MPIYRLQNFEIRPTGQSPQTIKRLTLLKTNREKFTSNLSKFQNIQVSLSYASSFNHNDSFQLNKSQIFLRFWLSW